MAIRDTKAWETGYEDYPDGTIHKMSIVDNDLRDLKAAINTAIGADHEEMDADQAGQHKNGTAAIWIVAAATTITTSDAEERRWVLGWAEDTGHIYLSHDLDTPGTFVWNDMGLLWGAQNQTWLVTAGFLLIETEDVDGVDTGPTVTTRDENVARTSGGRDFDNVHLIWVQDTVLNSVAGTKYKFEVKGWTENPGSGNESEVNPIEDSVNAVQIWSKMKVRLQPRLT